MELKALPAKSGAKDLLEQLDKMHLKKCMFSSVVKHLRNLRGLSSMTINDFAIKFDELYFKAKIIPYYGNIKTVL